jgi:hypothetical protein
VIRSGGGEVGDMLEMALAIVELVVESRSDEAVAIDDDGEDG